MKSESIKELAAALAKFQGSMNAIKRDGKAGGGKFTYKYSTLDAIKDAIKIPLLENGLSVTQLLDNDDGNIVIETLLMHISGEWVSGRYPIKSPTQDPKDYGKVVTYGRRYSLSAILGITAEEDTDAHTSNENEWVGQDKTTTQKQTKTNPTSETLKPPSASSGDAPQGQQQSGNAEQGIAIKNPQDPATPTQIKAINTILGKMGIDDEMVRHQTVAELLDLTEVPTSFTKLTKRQASDAIRRLGGGND